MSRNDFCFTLMIPQLLFKHRFSYPPRDQLSAISAPFGSLKWLSKKSAFLNNWLLHMASMILHGAEAEIPGLPLIHGATHCSLERAECSQEPPSPPPQYPCWIETKRQHRTPVPQRKKPLDRTSYSPIPLSVIH